jgi:hypothetical protein
MRTGDRGIAKARFREALDESGLSRTFFALADPTRRAASHARLDDYQEDLMDAER